LSFPNSAPKIDGRLDEKFWQKPPTISRLIPRQADGYAPVQTEAWLHHDTSHLYIGVRSHEPILRDVLSEATARDGAVREDDSIEILLDTNRDQKSFHHFAVNPEGVLYDANGKDATWNSTARVATAREEKKRAWTAEMAIPLKEIEADLAAHPTWGFQMTRNRPRFDERKSYEWSPSFWYRNLPSFFGRVDVE